MILKPLGPEPAASGAVKRQIGNMRTQNSSGHLKEHSNRIGSNWNINRTPHDRLARRALEFMSFCCKDKLLRSGYLCESMVANSKGQQTKIMTRMMSKDQSSLEESLLISEKLGKLVTKNKLHNNHNHNHHYNRNSSVTNQNYELRQQRQQEHKKHCFKSHQPDSSRKILYPLMILLSISLLSCSCFFIACNSLEIIAPASSQPTSETRRLGSRPIDQHQLRSEPGEPAHKQRAQHIDSASPGGPARAKRDTSQNNDHNENELSPPDSSRRLANFPSCTQLASMWSRILIAYPSLANNLLASQPRLRLLSLESSSPATSKWEWLLAPSHQQTFERLMSSPSFVKILRQHQLREATKAERSSGLQAGAGEPGRLRVPELAQNQALELEPAVAPNAELPQTQQPTINYANADAAAHTPGGGPLSPRKPPKHMTYGRILYHPNESNLAQGQADTLDKLHFLQRNAFLGGQTAAIEAAGLPRRRDPQPASSRPSHKSASHVDSRERLLQMQLQMQLKQALEESKRQTNKREDSSQINTQLLRHEAGEEQPNPFHSASSNNVESSNQAFAFLDQQLVNQAASRNNNNHLYLDNENNNSKLPFDKTTSNSFSTTTTNNNNNNNLDDPRYRGHLSKNNLVSKDKNLRKKRASERAIPSLLTSKQQRILNEIRRAGSSTMRPDTETNETNESQAKAPTLKNLFAPLRGYLQYYGQESNALNNIEPPHHDSNFINSVDRDGDQSDDMLIKLTRNDHLEEPANNNELEETSNGESIEEEANDKPAGDSRIIIDPDSVEELRRLADASGEELVEFDKPVLIM